MLERNIPVSVNLRHYTVAFAGEVPFADFVLDYD